MGKGRMQAVNTPRRAGPAAVPFAAGTGGRRGRPRGTSAREIEVISLRLFTERGFDETTVEDIASEAGVSRRTFFRYFESKSEILWYQFDDEVTQLRAAFDRVPARADVMTAIREVVVSVNHYGPEDVAELRARINLIGSVPALQASATQHYDAWERAVSDFAAQRRGEAADELIPLAIGRSTLAACRAAFDVWVRRGDAELTVYLDAALTALGGGFAG
jgi:mycofactocin system transcriptional regulator